MRLTTLVILVLLSAGLVTACGSSRSDECMTVAQAPYSENSLNNLHIGRQYLAQGRYELAREHFLMGLASARNGAMRQRLSQELQAAERMIQAQR